MDFDRINKWLTLVANIGVLVGILFLAYELNLSRTMATADINQNRAHARSEADLQIATNSENFVAADVKFQSLLREHSVQDAVARLTDEERYLIRRWQSSLMIRFDNVAFQHSLGLVPDSYFRTLVRGVQNFLPIWDELDVELPDTSRELYETAIAEYDQRDE